MKDSSKMSRRTLFGFGAAIVPAIGIHDATLDVLNDPPAPDIDPKIVDAAMRFVTETLPRCQDHFVRGDLYGAARTKGTAYSFDYSGSGQEFYVSALDRLAQSVNACLVEDEMPTFGVMGKRDWQTCVEIMTDLLVRHDPIAAIQARQRRDLKSRYFWWEGIPWFWDQALTDQNSYTIYVVNLDSMGRAARPGVTLNGMILNTNLS